MQELTKQKYFKEGEITTLEEISELVDMFIDCDWSINGGFYPLRFLGWEFEFSSKKTAFGTCSKRIGKKRIMMSRYLLENNLDKVLIIENAIRHEIAHAIDMESRGISDHSSIWRNIALQIGCDGKRKTYGLAQKKEKKYTLNCKHCDNEFGRHRMQKGREFSCGICLPNKFDRRYLLNVIQNF